jgi:chromosome partitioning protein
MKIITFANHKGGVGKTTSTLNVGYTLAAAGHQVLLIDCDAQRNLTRSFVLPEPHPNLGAVVSSKSKLSEVVLQTGQVNLSLVAASRELQFLEQVLTQQFGYEHLLRNELAPLSDRFAYVLIDTPPRLSALTYAALVASDRVFIPVQPEFYGFEGLEDLLQACQRVTANFNPKLAVGGLFFTKWSEQYRRRLHKEVVDLITEENPGLTMSTTIRDNVAIAEAQAQKQGLQEWAPTSNGAEDYQKLTTEILSRL